MPNVTEVRELRDVLERRMARRVLAENEQREQQIVADAIGGSGATTTVEAIETVVREIESEPWKVAARLINLEAQVAELVQKMADTRQWLGNVDERCPL
jgi:hypothetical protein